MSMKHFLTECESNDRMTLIIGQCGGGKTHLMLGTMKDHLKNNRFTQYHCVIPAYHMERDGSYDFLKNNPEYKKNVFIYNEYHPRISETLLNSQSEGIENGNAEHIFYFIDDATGEEKIWNDEFLIKIACKVRHLRISLFVVIHSQGANIISPPVRAQAQFVFLGNMNPSVLKKCYESYVNNSDFPTFKIFYKFFAENVVSNKYGLMFVDQIEGEYSVDVDKWFS